MRQSLEVQLPRIRDRPPTNSCIVKTALKSASIRSKMSAHSPHSNSRAWKQIRAFSSWNPASISCLVSRPVPDELRMVNKCLSCRILLTVWDCSVFAFVSSSVFTISKEVSSTTASTKFIRTKLPITIYNTKTIHIPGSFSVTSRIIGKESSKSIIWKRVYMEEGTDGNSLVLSLESSGNSSLFPTSTVQNTPKTNRLKKMINADQQRVPSEQMIPCSSCHTVRKTYRERTTRTSRISRAARKT
mmetsp:Transcript_37713/g.98785  ORF Transcript_37713/g.98785 Transcript_37713/m.98785 type:complete len:244 (-) Transcript_37713:18-749(-)